MKRWLEIATEWHLPDVLDLLRARLARWIAPARKGAARPTIDDALRAAGYKALPLAELAAPAPEPLAPIAKPKMPLPSPEAIDRARGVCAIEGKHGLRICRGSEKGCDGREDQWACRDCFLVEWHDKRSGAEILKAMARGDA